MNLRAIVSLFIIFSILALLIFSPRARDFRVKLTKPIGSFLKAITGRSLTRTTSLIPKKLDVKITNMDPVSMNGQHFSIKGTGLNTELVYDLVSVMNGNILFQTKTVKVRVKSMVGSVSFYKNGKMKIIGHTNLIELNGMKFNRTGMEFLIVGTPVSYTLNNIRENKISFSKASGSLSWSGLKGVPPLLKNDELELVGFEGVIEQKEGPVTIHGKVDRIRLNGVDIRLD